MTINFATQYTVPSDVSGLTADIWSPAVEALRDGRTAVVWTEDKNNGIWLRLYDGSGAPEGSAIQVTDAGERGNRPSVAQLENGDFIVTYTSLSSATNAQIAGKTFSPDGTPAGAGSIIFEDATTTTVAPDTAGLSNGGAITTFSNLGLDGDAFGVYARLTHPDGTPAGSAFRINQTTESFQSGGVPAALADGGFVITWRSRDVDGSFYAVMMRSFDADGTPRSGEIRVNQFSYLSQTNPDITVLSDGRFVITWTSDVQDGSDEGIYGRVFSSGGIPEGPEFRVNTTTENGQKSSTVAATPDGGFVVVWMHETSSSITDIRQQRFDASGAPVGTESVLANGPSGVSTAPDIAIGEDGVVSVVWINTNQGDGVATVLLAVAGVQVGGTLSNDLLDGTMANDSISASLGDDTLNGSGGDDTLVGGRGQDSIHGGVGDDSIRGGDDNDTVFGDSGDDFVLGGNGSDVLYGGSGNNRLFGQRGEDTLIGGSQNDRLNGGGGSDFLQAGQGNDWFRAGNGDDTLWGGAGRDTLLALSGDDSLVGGAGNDRLNGGGGRDTLDGGTGNDYLKGGTGVDVFVFRTGMGSDQIHSYNRDEDILRISSALLDGQVTGDAVVDAFGSVAGKDVVLDFGDGNTLTFLWANRTDGIADDILIF